MTLDYEGVTVDCRYGDMNLEDCIVKLIDTPGFDDAGKNRTRSYMIESSEIYRERLKAQINNTCYRCCHGLQLRG